MKQEELAASWDRAVEVCDRQLAGATQRRLDELAQVAAQLQADLQAASAPSPAALQRMLEVTRAEIAQPGRSGWSARAVRDRRMWNDLVSRLDTDVAPTIEAYALVAATRPGAEELRRWAEGVAQRRQGALQGALVARDKQLDAALQTRASKVGYLRRRRDLLSRRMSESLEPYIREVDRANQVLKDELTLAGRAGV